MYLSLAWSLQDQGSRHGAEIDLFDKTEVWAAVSVWEDIITARQEVLLLLFNTSFLCYVNNHGVLEKVTL